MLNSLAEILPEAAHKYGDKLALIDGGRHFSFRELDRLSTNMAINLVAFGLLPGERVTLYGANSWQWVVSYFAALKAGGVVNPLNVMLTAAEVGYIMGDCQSSVLIAAPQNLGAIGAASVRLMISVDDHAPLGVKSFERMIAPPAAILPLEPGRGQALSTICYTSGTTGHPKGAMLSHNAILMNAGMTALMHARTAEDVVVSALPLPHVYGNIVMNSSIFCGSALVLHAKFDAAAILESIEVHRATLFEGVPTMYAYLLDHPDLERRNLSSLRRCTVGGQNMAPARMQLVEAALGCPLIELWGMTELGGLGTTFAAHGPRLFGSIGVALPYMRLAVADLGSGQITLASDVMGELVIKSPTQMSGYYNNTEATAEAIDSEGWLHTGDIVKIDASGYVFMLDRLKDMIITGGYNIYPAELERVILKHPDVFMAAVGPVPDAQKGELAKAYIVLKPGAAPDEAAILDFCRCHLAAYKVPRAVQFVGDLPKTSTGKIMRRKLREFDFTPAA